MNSALEVVNTGKLKLRRCRLPAMLSFFSKNGRLKFKVKSLEKPTVAFGNIER